MSKTADVLYGRRGGVLQPIAAAPVAARFELPWPRGGHVAVHMAEHHRPVDPAVLAEASLTELRGWHEAEHRTRDPKEGDARHAGHLVHTHPDPKAKTR